MKNILPCVVSVTTKPRINTKEEFINELNKITDRYLGNPVTEDLKFELQSEIQNLFESVFYEGHLTKEHFCWVDSEEETYYVSKTPEGPHKIMKQEIPGSLMIKIKDKDGSLIEYLEWRD